VERLVRVREGSRRVLFDAARRAVSAKRRARALTNIELPEYLGGAMGLWFHEAVARGTKAA